MASIVTEAGQSYGRPTLSAQLLTNITATDQGSWFNIAGFFPVSIHVDGAAGNQIQLLASNRFEAPPSHIGVQASGIVNEDRIIILPAPVRWVRARVTGYTSGTINVYLFGVMN